MGRARAPGGGRRPRPTAAKRLDGNPGHRPLNQREPQPPKDMPECPAVLVGEARAEWDRMSAQLHRTGLLTAIDGAALTAYCIAWARVVEAQAKLQEYGSVIKSPNGCLMQSPYLAILNRALEQLMRAAVEFGMTPSSRSRVQTKDVPGYGVSGLDENGEEDRGALWLRTYGR